MSRNQSAPPGLFSSSSPSQVSDMGTDDKNPQTDTSAGSFLYTRGVPIPPNSMQRVPRYRCSSDERATAASPDSAQAPHKSDNDSGDPRVFVSGVITEPGVDSAHSSQAMDESPKTDRNSAPVHSMDEHSGASNQATIAAESGLAFQKRLHYPGMPFGARRLDTHSHTINVHDPCTEDSHENEESEDEGNPLASSGVLSAGEQSPRRR